ncbi:MAG TPA: hypothetical protein PLT27_06505, partial [Nitrospira sp.]|nr:hypothetical protein [Nitrospira sp.]
AAVSCENAAGGLFPHPARIFPSGRTGLTHLGTRSIAVHTARSWWYCAAVIPIAGEDDLCRIREID